MVKKEDWQVLERLIDDCICAKGRHATKAFVDLNHFIGKLRKEYGAKKENERA